jgi:ribosomal protein S18 acetylase RimI-like enzyme
MNPIQIVEYLPEHRLWFDRFNRQWIEEMFEMESVDEWVLCNPDKAILEPGGAILMALWNDEMAGTVGLRKLDEDIYEFTKMAVDPAYRRRGIAEALSYSSFRKAATMGASRVVLYSNTRNEEAIKLYEKLGFNHVPVEHGIYKRANVKMVINIGMALHRAEQYERKIAKSLTITT